MGAQVALARPLLCLMLSFICAASDLSVSNGLEVQDFCLAGMSLTSIEKCCAARYLTVLGAANKRLYQFRLQTADKSYEKAAVIQHFLFCHESAVIAAW